MKATVTFLIVLGVVCRLEAATFIVTSADDSGAGTLREAVELANSTPGLDKIRFDTGGFGPLVIALASQLPVITEAVSIDGEGVVTLSGVGAGPTSGLVVAADDVDIRGLAIEGFERDGVRNLSVIDNLSAADALIAGELEGTSASATVDETDILDPTTPVPGNWIFDNAVPGGGGDDYAILVTGTFEVTTEGDYSFAAGTDDGSRLRVDGADVIVDDALHGFLQTFGSVWLSVGTHTFEWVGFERGGGAVFELSVASGIVSGAPFDPLDPTVWAALGDAGAAVIGGPFDVTTYYFESEPVTGLSVVGNVFEGNNRGVYISQPRDLVESLDTVDAMVSGEIWSELHTATIDEADLIDSSFIGGGNYSFDNPIPGGGGDDFGVVATGTLLATEVGLYSFALSNDDGARLRIDGVDIVVDDTLHALQNFFGTVLLSAGEHSFEWVGFERGGEAQFELSVASGAVSGDLVDPLDQTIRKVVGAADAALQLVSEGITVDAYYINSTADQEITIEDNEFSSNSNRGVEITDALGGRILGNNFANEFVAAQVLRGQGSELTGNTVAGALFGLVLTLHTRGVISENELSQVNNSAIWVRNRTNGSTVSDNSVHNVNWAVRLNNSFVNHIMDNHVEQFGLGIDLISSNQNEVGNNHLEGGNAGILLRSSDDNTVGENDISGCFDGTVVLGSAGNLLEDNVSHGNAANGFLLIDSGENKLENNEATSNSTGFLLDFSSGNKLEKNSASLNTGNGFELLSFSNNNKLEENTADGNGGSGFVLVDVSDNTLEGNFSTQNFHGYSLTGSDLNYLEENSGVANDGYGIFFSEASLGTNILEGNTFELNGLGDSNIPLP